MFNNSKDDKSNSPYPSDISSYQVQVTTANYPPPAYQISDYYFNADAQISPTTIYSNYYRSINGQQLNTAAVAAAAYSDYIFTDGAYNQSQQDDFLQHQYQHYQQHYHSQNSSSPSSSHSGTQILNNNNNNNSYEYETATGNFVNNNDNNSIVSIPSTASLSSNTSSTSYPYAIQSKRMQSRNSPNLSTAASGMGATKATINDLNNKIAHKIAPIKSEPSILEMNKPKRGRLTAYHHQLPDNAVESLNTWFEIHIKHPYPTAEEKHSLAGQCGITVKQVNSWFCNRRNRSQNTKPKRIKRQLQEEMSSILHELALNRPLAIEKLCNTLALHDIDIS